MKKVILITGGSQGIGASTARLAAKNGYMVVINYHQNHTAATELVREIEEDGGEAIAFQADVSDEKEIESLFVKIDSKVGSVTALVNNAGIIDSQMRFIDMTAARLHKTFATNVMGSFICAREAIRRMSTKNKGTGGSIVNVSSIAARLGAPFEYIDYAASKGAIESMTIGLAKEIAEENIRVNAVRPGLIRTDIHTKAGEPGRIERLQNTIPLKRAGLPEEVAQTILWLLSNEASYVTGAIIDVTGGR
jgi:NAD(P)-dependent dehydrogenase (short-subunit alcohol dehydrogenase family)